jgi:Family of unknown function (DUF6069)
VPDIKQGRARALSVAGGALAAARAWIVEVPLLGIHLNFRFGTGHIHTIPVGQVIGAAVAASLLGWLLLTLLERRTGHARLLWTTIALAALAASLALPLAAATTTSATAGLIVMHLTVAAAVIPPWPTPRGRADSTPASRDGRAVPATPPRHSSRRRAASRATYIGGRAPTP